MAFPFSSVDAQKGITEVAAHIGSVAIIIALALYVCYAITPKTRCFPNVIFAIRSVDNHLEICTDGRW
jgi:hypothetical protein